MAFHDLTGGGQSYGYAFQLLPTPELNNWTVDSTLDRPGTQVKAELAAVSGTDAVVLGDTQTGQATDYARLGWRHLGDAPSVYSPPHPTGLAAEWSRAATVLVVGATKNSHSHPYNDIFERATEGMIPFENGWLVRGRSPYIDDYSDQELSKKSVLLLLGYRYHNARTAWDRLDRFVRNGGSLYVETGWQYVDPDWNAGAGPAVLPVDELRWKQLDPQAPVRVNGRVDPAWAPMVYEGKGWGASSSRSVRSGADTLVQVGDQVVVARWTRGSGRVLWSGMNLMAHAHANPSSDEMAFLAAQWKWLLPQSSVQMPIEPHWLGNDTASLALQASDEPALVLFKESAAPGWSAELRWPGGSQRARIEPAEMDFMLVRLDSIPAGAELAFHYGPTLRVIGSWLLSLMALGLLLAWLFYPVLFLGAKRGARRLVALAVQRVRTRWKWDEEEGPVDFQ